MEAPVTVTVDVPAVHVDPTPEVFQFPLTVHAPVVAVRDPEAPIMVTSDTTTMDAFAVKMPPFPMVRAPPVRAKLFVARVVVPGPPWIVMVPDQARAFAAIVNVTVDAPLLNAKL